VRTRTIAAQVAFVAMAAASQLQAQKALDLTADGLDRFLKGADAENVEMGKTGDQLKELDAKIDSFRKCKAAFDAAGTGNGKSGLALRLLMRAKCGASDDGDMVKDREKILKGPQEAGAKTAGLKLNDYLNLKSQITNYFGGDRSGFTAKALELLDARQADLSKTLGLTMVRQSGGSAGGMSGAHMPGMWTPDYAWVYLGQIFAMEYASGASVFEQPYKPGEWTRWTVTDPSNTDGAQTIERAFLAMTADSSEWWRLKTITPFKDNGQTKADTVVMEAQYKPTSPYTKEIVRVRAKLPGNKDPQELMVPQGMGMINYNGFFGSKPSKESVDGATVGTEKITTGAGAFTAKHVRFGNGGGNLDWWLTPDAPGGWVKFTGTSSGSDKGGYTMEMVAKGTGAKSELGVVIK